MCFVLSSFKLKLCSSVIFFQFKLVIVLVQDEGGALWRSDLPDFKMTKLLEFHAGSIIGVVSSPISHEMASAGSDGTVSSSHHGYFRFALEISMDRA